MKHGTFSRSGSLLLAIMGAVLVANCGGDDKTIVVHPGGGEGGGSAALVSCTAKGQGINRKAAMQKDCPHLADYRLFQKKTDPTSKPRGDGMKYTVSTLLFSNYAQKARILFLPKKDNGDFKKAVYAKDDPFEFPVGTIIAKTFYYPHGGNKRLVETRLLIYRKDGWKGLPYVWNESETQATLMPYGASRNEYYINDQGKKITPKKPYQVPSERQCGECHRGAVGKTPNHPIGLKARFLNLKYTFPDGGKENQLTHMKRLGMLKGAPSAGQAPKAIDANDPSSGSVKQRARAYLDANCSYCHRSNGAAGRTGFYLYDYFHKNGLERPLSLDYGICKLPESAGNGAGGLTYDIVPGKPDKSIVIYRISSNKLGVAMPELSRNVVDKSGVALIRKWIKQMEGSCGGNSG